MNTVSIVGLGYVGLPLADLASKKGYQVTGIDINQELVRKLNHKYRRQKSTSSILFTDQYDSIQSSDIIIICVPTPVSEDKKPDLSPVIAACTKIAKFLQKSQLVIIESTVNPGVCDDIVIPILEKNAQLKCGVDFYLAHCPERINPGDKQWNVGNIARVVGGANKNSLRLATEFYRSIIKAGIKPMQSLKEAEAVKIVENCFRDINIAFVNELAMYFDTLGIDVVNVIDGAKTKPFSFMAHYPGIGVGGHCIPVDPYYLIESAREQGFKHHFLSEARYINERMPFYILKKLESALNEVDIKLEKAKIAILGLTYKPDVEDMRESPSLALIKELQKKNIQLVAYDPYIDSLDGVNVYNSAENRSNKPIYDAIHECNAIIIATGHSAFKMLDPHEIKKLGVKVVLDGRNFLDSEKFKKAGLIYRGVGRQ